LNNYVEVTGVQLEKGSVATPFEMRALSVELLMCQRYYYRRVNESPYDRYGFFAANSNTVSYGQVLLPTRMRANPVVGVSAATDFVYMTGASWFTDVNSSSTYMGIFRIVGSGFTTSNVQQLIVSGKTVGTVWVDFNAELSENTAAYDPTSLTPYWYYSFNGTLTDSVRANNFTNNGAPITYTVGRKGACVYLDLNTPSTSPTQTLSTSTNNLFGNMSIAMWINVQGSPPSSGEVFNVIMNAPPHKLYVVNDAGTLRFSFNQLTSTWQGFNSVASISLNQWIHMIYTYAESGGNGVARLYINGALNTTFNVTGLTSQYSGVTIGNDGLTRAFKGMIDELLFFNRTLTATEAANLAAM
jgi:hypothetical protein